VTAIAWAAPILILGGCAAIAWSMLGGHQVRCLPRVIAYRATRAALRVLIAVRSAPVRARWAWLCRKPPAHREGKLSRADYLTFVGLVETWRQSGEPERDQESLT
jgi:hypothetical protein